MAIRKSGFETLANTTTAGNQLTSSLTALANGRFAIAWMDDSMTGGDMSGAAVRAQIFNADGSKFGAEFLVNTTTSDNQRNPVLDAQSGGGFVAAFDSGSGLADIKARLFDAAGNPLVNGVTANTDDFQINTTTAGAQLFPAVAELAGGRIVVAFTTPQPGPTELRARVFSANGTPVTSDFIVSSGAAGTRFNTSVGALAGGGFVVSFTDPATSSNPLTYARLFDSSGNAVVNDVTDTTESFLVRAADAFGFSRSVGLAGGGFVVVSHSDGGLFGRLFESDGTPIFLPDGDLRKYGLGVFPISSSGFGSIAAMPNGGFVATYNANDDIYAQVFSPLASKVGAPFLVSTTNGGAQSEPTVSVLADGRIAISWTDFSQTGGDPSGGAIRFQIIDPNAAATTISDSVNGDNFSDILWQNDDGTAGLWLMNGFNRIADSAIGFNPGPTWHVKGPGDFNFDGLADILWQNVDGTAGIWLMNGFTRLAGANVGFNPGPSWKVIDAGDFNGDGKSDILWQNDNGTAGVWLMDGFTVIAEGTVGGSNPGPSWHVKASGDFDGNGKSDILWQHDNGTAGIWLMNGLERLSGNNLDLVPGPSWKIIDTGDFNGDGRSDILWQNDDGTAGIWLMETFFRKASANIGFNPGPSWKVKTAGDYNGDGKSDILWQNDNGQPGIWLMNGLNVLAESGIGFNPGPTWHVQPDLI